MHQQNSLKLFRYINNIFWLLKGKTSGISEVIVHGSNQKMLLIESKSNDFWLPGNH